MVMCHDCIICELVHGKGKWNREKQVLYLHNQMERGQSFFRNNTRVCLEWVDSKPCLVQINLYQSQIHPRGRGFVRESRAPGGAQCKAGRRVTAGREEGRGVRRAVGQVSRGRLILGRTVVALAGGGPGPVSVAVA